MDAIDVDLAISASLPPPEHPEPDGPMKAGPSSISPGMGIATKDLPPRPNSHPLPPRKNDLGLPPAYVSHLGRLLRQWLEQQVNSAEASSTNAGRLWDDEKIRRLERSIWDGVIVPANLNQSGNQDEKLLRLPWNQWAAASYRRQELWRRELDEKRGREAKASKSDKAEESKSSKAKKRASANENDGEPRSLLLVGDEESSASKSPDRRTSRPSSVASVDRDTPLKRKDPGRSPLIEASSSMSPADQNQERTWLEAISRLQGFEPFLPSQKDEWAVLEDDFAVPKSPNAHVPGAFPQAYDRDQHYQQERRQTPSPAFHSNQNEGSLVKPLFCVSFVPDTPGLSSSTLNLHRQASSTSTLRRDSFGSNQGNWWAGSGRGWAGLAGLGLPAEDGKVDISFVRGKIALPSGSEPHSRRPSITNMGGHGVSESSISTSSDDVDAIATEDDERRSERSDTAQPSTRKPQQAVNMIISGGEDDIPHSPEEPVHLVGGTIAIRGHLKDEEQQAMARVLTALLYTTQAMFLELELLDAFRIAREADPSAAPTLPPKDFKSRSYDAQEASSSSMRRNRSIKERGEKAKGFLSRLGKDTKGLFEGLVARNRRDTIGSPRPSTEPAAAGPSLPMSASVTLPPPSSSTMPRSDLDNAPVSHTTDRYLQQLQRLENLIPSTTPGLRLPMPPLLLRVKEEDRVRREKAAQEIEEGTNDHQADSGFLQPGSGASTPVRDPLRGRALGYRMGGDVRAGLGALASGMDTFEGWGRLQQLEVLRSVGVNNGDSEGREVMCRKPVHETMVYWDKRTDRNVEGALDELSAAEIGLAKCPRSDCKVNPENHVIWYLHGSKRLCIKQTRLETTPGEGLDSWVQCRECGKTSFPRTWSDSARCFSWGKFLELLLYSDVLVPRDLCEHSQSTDKSASFTQFVRDQSNVFTLSVDSISVLDTRLPKLQVGPNVAKRKAGKGNALLAVEGLFSKDHISRDHIELLSEIQRVSNAFRFRIEALRGMLRAERATGPADEMEERDKGENVADISDEREESLAKILDDIEKSESSLKESIDPVQLNDARIEFARSVKRIEKDMAGWQAQHDVPIEFGDIPLDLPSYMQEGKIHALPGSSVLLREDEPSSIFAYTLSSLAYFTELSNKAKAVATADGPTSASEPAPDTAGSTSQDDGWKIEIKRRDAPRDLLSLRSLAKKRSEASMARGDTKTPMALTPNQPSLEISLEQVAGTMSKTPVPERTTTFRPRTPSTSDSDVADMNTPRQFRIGGLPMVRRTSDSTSHTAPPSAFRPTAQRSVSSTVPSTPRLGPTSSPNPALPILAPSRPRTPETASSQNEGWTSSVTNSITSSFNNLIKMGSEVGALSSIKMRGGDRGLTSLIGPLSMMSAMDNSLSNTGQDELPHIQFTYTLEDRLKIGCTVYYATAFDSLRRRCAIDKSMISSLARCEIWEAQGGKSKASFFMTQDKRYIVKELVSKWNVSDTQALLEIAPVYFEHLAGTHNKATSLAKIVCFFTVKINDMKASTKKQMDLLVMENLFYKQTITQKYDLKGIESRKAPKSVVEAQTLFDCDWMDLQAKAPLLLHPHAKRILQEAIALDTRFLCRESIMDYSLLLGLDAAKKELVVGLVDAIGSFNLFKTIESRGKLALTRGGEVTVIPPDQYRERFETALKHYFLVCPDKWSKTSRRGHAALDTLPSVF